MKILSIQNLCIVILVSLTLLVSCDKGPDHVDFDCGPVETEIVELSHSVGSYSSSNFSSTNALNFKIAAIAIYVENFEITTETETSCFDFTALPQLIEEIRITSSNSVTSGGIEFAKGEDLMELFILHNKELTYSVSEFISAQNEDPLLFHMEGDEVVLQLLSQPDVTINQSFEIQLSFSESKNLSIEIPLFEVTN